MKTDFMKIRFNDRMLHVAYDCESLTFIRATDARSGKEVILDDYDTQIMNERIVDHVSE